MTTEHFQKSMGLKLNLSSHGFGCHGTSRFTALVRATCLVVCIAVMASCDRKSGDGHLKDNGDLMAAQFNSGFKVIPGVPLFPVAASTAEIDDVESFFGVTLPAEYVAFVNERNGWKFEEPLFFEFDDGRDGAVFEMRAHVRMIFGVCSDRKKYGSIVERRGVLCFDERVPTSEFCCIGTGIGYSVIAICVAPDDYGAIYLLENNLPPSGPPCRDELRRVCGSFKELWNGLKKDSIGR